MPAVLRYFASAPRVIAVIVLLLASFTLASCGSSGGQASAGAGPGLPPAIPAADPILLFVGTGTTSADVSAVEAILAASSLTFATADSSQLDALSEQQLAGYKLIIVPGGNSITIGQNVSAAATAAIRGAVQQYGTHYLGICAGAFFAGFSIYNGVDLTGGVSFDFYSDEFRGIHLEPLELSFSNMGPLDMYWQDGPQLAGWGSVVAKFPDGSPAIVEGQSGKGFVIFTGIHAEAPESWRGALVFNTPINVDLAYAGTLVQAALNGTQLPHF